MKTKYAFILVLVSILVSNYSAFAQDIIFTKDNSQIQAIVQEINEESLIYRNFDNPTGPIYRVPISDLVKVSFQNGNEKVFNSNETETSVMFVSSLPLEYSKGAFYLDGKRLSQSQLESILLNDSFYTYLSAEKQRSSGKGLTVAGSIIIASSVSLFAFGAYLQDKYDIPESEPGTIDNKYFPLPELFMLNGTLGTLAGLTLVSIGVPLLISGSRSLNWISEDYNSHIKPSTSLSFGPQRNGIGFALNF